MIKFKGSGVALVTPFTKNNKINFEKLYELIEYHINNNTDYIVICGTTGESATLSLEEKKELISKSIKYANGRIPIVCGTGLNNTEATIELSKFASNSGADALLIVSPYYNKGNDKGIYLHYTKIAKEVYPTQIILYNVPSRTGLDLSVDLITKLSKISNIVAIKEASTSLEKISKIIYYTKNENFYLISGNDILTPAILSYGGIGAISVCANIIPNSMHKICNGDIESFRKNFELIEALSLDVNPIMIKTAMNYLGFDIGNLRLPLYNSNEEKNKILKNIIDKTV